MTDPFLPPEVIERITCKQQAKAQCRALERMKIPYIRDAYGRPLVLCDEILPQRDNFLSRPNYEILGEL